LTYDRSIAEAFSLPKTDFLITSGMGEKSNGLLYSGVLRVTYPVILKTVLADATPLFKPLYEALMDSLNQ
jgi:hypothetical protein